MSTLHTINGRPVDPSPVLTGAGATVAPTPTVKVDDPTVTTAAPSQTHKPECGIVGETGEHGDLGSNASK